MSSALMRTGMGAMGLGPPLDDLLDPGWRFPDTQPGYSPPVFLPSGSREGSSAPPWWAVVGPGIIQSVRDIFAPVGTSQAAYGAARPTVYAGAGYTDQYGNVIPRTSVQPGASLTTGGLNLFGSQIGWGTIALVGGIIVLVQMQGFTRRR